MNLPLDFRRSTLLWILGITFVLGMGVEVFKMITSRDVNFPLTVADDAKAMALRQKADSIMHARMVAASAPVNINSASAAEFEKLDGIGPVLAQRIIAYREQHGPFVTVDDLNAVSGIGTKRLDAIRERCTVN